MSSTTNFLGSANGALGPINIYVITGDIQFDSAGTDTETYLGGTQGATLTFNQEKADIMYDQYGTKPANRVVVGEELSLEASLVQTTQARLAAVFQEFTSHASGFSQASAIGQDDISVVKSLKLIRVVAGVNSTDADDTLYMPAAAPMGTASWSFDAATQRVTGVSFTCYKSTKYVRASDDAPLWFFTRSAIQDGFVALNSGELF